MPTYCRFCYRNEDAVEVIVSCDESAICNLCIDKAVEIVEDFRRRQDEDRERRKQYELWRQFAP